MSGEGMNDSNGKTKKPAAKKRQAGRRPATIDLEASEMAGSESSQAETPPEETGAAGSNDADKPETEAAHDPARDEPATGDDHYDAGHDGEVPPGGAEATPEPPRRAGYGAVIGAAVLGAVLSLGGYVGAERAGLLRTADAPANVSARLDALATNLETMQAELDTKDNGLSARLDAIEARVSELARAGGSARPAAIENLEQRLAGAEAQLTLLRSEQTNLLERLRAVGGQEDAAGAVAALSQRLDTLEATLRERGETAEARAGEIDALKSRIDAMQGRVETVATQRPQADARAAQAIAIAGLDRAVAAGSPFARELGVVAELVGQRSEIDALRPMASSGVARLDELTRSFEEAASQALAAADSGSGSDFVGRLLSSARDIVRVRPTGDVEGNDTGAILARAEADLKGGDLLAATQELSALGEAPRQAMASWLAEARQRLTALRQVQSLSESAMSALRERPAGAER